MSLTFGPGPLSPHHGPLSFPLPQHAAFIHLWEPRVRAVIGGKILLDTQRAKQVYESGGLPTMWVPLADLDQNLIRKAEDRDGTPTWDIVIGDRVVAGAVTGYASGKVGDTDLSDHVTVAVDVVDRWFNEDEPVYAHFKDPYHRVDVYPSSRHVVVRHNGTLIAESHRPMLLYETGLPVRYYLPFIDTNLGLLSLSETVSECPYKGDGQHWHLTLEGQRIEDAAWSLPHPLPEGIAAAEHICFYPNKVETEVDGARVTS